MATLLIPETPRVDNTPDYRIWNEALWVVGEPDFHVDGVGCRRVVVGRDVMGNPLYDTARVRINTDVRSVAWREGC